MDYSAKPLLWTMIAAIVVMALTVHASAISDPAYGSDVLTTSDAIVLIAGR